jgi:hypothetical protein
LYDAHRLNVEFTTTLQDQDQSYDGLQSYGFMVWRKNGYSLPKGMIGSYAAYFTKGSSVTVEFSIQSPTGDASDFHHYTFPCLNKQQAIAMVDLWYDVVSMQVEIENAKVKHQYLYS